MSDRDLASASDRVFDWMYRFEDNSLLVGKVRGRLEGDRDCLIDPEPIEARYLDIDGKTVLVHWQAEDFIAFEMADAGKDILIVASNDNCTKNSLCLVSGISRSRAQVTDEGLQVIGESFQFPAWSVKAEATANQPAISWGWSVSPFFPFLSLRVNLQSTTTKKIYRWTVSPYLPFFPLVEVAESVA
ncbi:hypothetical protein V0288_01725 [Pannus brasiliensis CCIBt3594]|uniref:Uncharacterized protein n=1 Tax=Pannus brasiliensis CCIBt3594 TaxID=1427578 RepID=A0AAW9QQF5_9CHRO